MSNLQINIDSINKMEPAQIIRDENVKNRFVFIHETLWGGGEAAYEAQAIHFEKWIADNQQTANAVTRFSIFTAFIDLAVCGLSVEPGVRALCYLQGSRVCIGNDASGKKVYEARLKLTVSGYGELVLRSRTGQIKYADNPVIVYENDSFSFSDNNGQKSVQYTCNLPHDGKRIAACFIRIVRTDGSVDYSVMYPEDWRRLSEYSAKQNRKYNQNTRQYEAGQANELYYSNNGDIDTGFLIAKTIKHAFKTYPKARIGKETELQTETIDKQPELDIDSLYESEIPEREEQSFAPQKDMSAGVVMENKANDDVF